jgi:ligand-binding sensor domain-containing protein/signal transduction histidine kinase
MLKKLLIFTGLKMIMACATAQAPALYFEKITVQNGLSNNKVNCILQDKRGFMWLGTNDGLNRFDGNNFSIFRNKPGDSSSISGNIITALLEDKNELLWIATADGGLTRYDYKKPPAQQFKQYKHLPGDSSSIPVNAVNALLEDNNGYLWLGTGGKSVIRFDKKTGRFEYVVKTWTRTVLALTMDKSGIIWAGRQGGGILKINPATFAYESDKRYDDLYAKLPHVVVTSLFCDSEKNIWYGAWDKFLYKYDAATGREFTYTAKALGGGFSNDVVTSMAEDKKGRLWIGCKTNGLQLFDKASGEFYHFTQNPLQEGSLTDNSINCIYTDRSGTTWIGTSRGISINSPRQQQFVQTFLSPAPKAGTALPIYDFYKDEKNDLWIGTGDGIYLQQSGNASLRHIPLSYNGTALAVTKFFRDKKGQLYLGTNYSLFLFNPVTFAIKLLPNTEKDQVMNRIIESRVVSAVEEVIEGNPAIMVSPYGHYLAYYDLVKQQWVSRLDTVKKIIQAFNIKDNLVHKLYKAADGKIWLANTKEGLGEWVNGTAPKINFYKNNPLDNSGLSNNHVYDIAGDTSSNLWISTYGGGLNYFNTAAKKFTHLAVTGNLLEGIATDKQGNVWMICNGHLQRYNLRTKSAATFNLPDLEKSGGISGYIYTDDAGKMYVSGNNYFIAFNPDSVKDDNQQPQVYLTDFKIFNASYSHLLAGKTIDLSYRQNYFTLEFAAPGYSSTEPVQYAYMLEGADKDWVECGTRNFAPFSNLKGGSYTFKVRASNKPGTWSENVYSIKIVITPPIWERWWFYGLCALVIAAAAYLAYRYRINELLKRQAIRNKIAQDLHDNVGSTLSSISVYSQVAQIQNEGGNQQALNDILGKISTTSTDMISELSDTVWAINPANDSMEKILQRMESFARPLMAARNIQFNFTYGEDIKTINLDMEKRKNFYLIFKEIINNAIKYSGSTHITAAIAVKNNQLLLTVKDNGVGFNKQKELSGQTGSLSGNGLRNMLFRAKEMKGQLDIETAAGMGTAVSLHCPIP